MADVYDWAHPDVLRLLAEVDFQKVHTADGSGPHWFPNVSTDLLVQAVYLDDGLWCGRWCRMSIAQVGDDAVGKFCGPWLILDPRPYVKEMPHG